MATNTKTLLFEHVNQLIVPLSTDVNNKRNELTAQMQDSCMEKVHRGGCKIQPVKIEVGNGR